MSDMVKDHILDRPNSYIGRSVPRPNIKRLMAGRGIFTDDVKLPRMVHVAFLRSPYAHAEIVEINKVSYDDVQNWIQNYHGNLNFFCTLDLALSPKDAGVGLARKLLADKASKKFQSKKLNGILVYTYLIQKKHMRFVS